jgi:uncharacterized protein YjlB
MSISVPNKPTQVLSEIISSQGYFPNNNFLPLLIYKNVFNTNYLASGGIKKLFEQNSWGNTWVNGIYDYHHYHSNTHEVLVIISGYCNVIYGGPQGKVFKISEGDVIIHPVGVSHKKENSSENFSCVGAYPNSISYDMFYGKKEEHPEVDINIKKVKLPEMDPVFGSNGILQKHWR